ncbi:MAG: type VI secretion system baseplate subunit TssK [Rhodocyclaceae bacterium]
MSWYNKVVWSEGLFLRPQLFQQQERYLEHYVHKRGGSMQPFFWGFDRYAIDSDALHLGKLIVSGASGIFQDGTPFDAPAHAPLPPALTLRHEHIDQLVYLATPIRSPNTEETSFSDDEASQARYQVYEEDLLDANSISQGPKLVQLSSLRLRLIPEKELTQSWIGLPMARVVELRADGSALVDADHIPPVNVYGASAHLRTWLSEIHGLTRLRAESLAKRLTTNVRSGDAAEISEYLVLQVLNRYEPDLQHLTRIGRASPEQLYRIFTCFAGELATFVRPETRRPKDYEPYRHEAPYICIRPIVDDLRLLLNVVLERGARRIELHEQQHGIRLASVDPAHISRYANFVLAVGAQMPSDALSRTFPTQAKLAPSGMIADLLRLHLPGIPLLALPVPPRQIPFNAGYVYFELSREHPLWGQVEQYGGLALHVAGAFPDMQLELWGILE